MEVINRKTVTTCPVCDGALRVTNLECESCGTVLQGTFNTCPYCSLSQELHDFLTTFVRCEGVIREIEGEMGISYPAVKNRIRKLKAALGMNGEHEVTREERTEEVLQAVKDGEMSVKKAIFELRVGEGGT